jgi:hypothetical protein
MIPSNMTLEYAIELAVDAIDANFGQGYARAHPELLAAQLQAAAIHTLALAISELPGL